jgi:hypothetical protein
MFQIERKNSSLVIAYFVSLNIIEKPYQPERISQVFLQVNRNCVHNRWIKVFFLN